MAKKDECPPSPHTRLEYSFFPRDFIDQQNPRFLNPDEAGIKGLIYSVRYLPRTNTWFARGLLGPVETHPQLPLLAGMSQGQYAISLPETTSHNRAGVFSTGSLNTGDVETIQSLDSCDLRPGASELDIIRTTKLVDALGRRLAVATIAVIDMVLGDELDQQQSTTKLVSNGPTARVLSSVSHRIVSSYNR